MKPGYRSELTRAAADVNILLGRMFQESEEDLLELTKLHNHAVETGEPIPISKISSLLTKWSSQVHANGKVMS